MLTSWTDTSPLTGKATHIVKYNNKPGSYDVGVYATTGAQVNVNASTTLENGVSLSSDSTSGWSNTQLWMHVST
jgi:hypothetical protein